MNLIFCSNMIQKKEGLPYSLLTYNVLPRGTSSGMLQIVKNSKTFYSIDDKYQDIWHFFRMENFDGQRTNRETHTKFLETAAVYSVISFLLNVGDRHLDNIMVTSQGEFFHIDYGFILGEEPTFKKALGAKSRVRIPQKMKDTILGSINGEEAYKEFTNACEITKKSWYERENCLKEELLEGFEMFLKPTGYEVLHRIVVPCQYRSKTLGIS